MHLLARPLRVLLLTLTLGLAPSLALLGVASSAPAHADAPAPTLAVSGTGVSLRPAFDPTISRYAVATTADTGGSVTVDAATPDPSGTVLVDGVPADGPVTLTGLADGAEISVIIDDVSGHHAYGLIVLPAAFPAITKTVDTGAEQAGQVLLTLGTYAVAVDANGVPTKLRDFGRAVADLKPAPNGHYTVMALQPGSTNNWELHELDDTFATIAPSPYRTVGLVNTDDHDSVLEPDGTRYLVGYEPDASTGLIDPTIQQVDPAGNVVYTWDGGDHLDPAAETTNSTASGPAADWAHINAIQVLDNGDVLASFRHLSAVLRIAWTAHDGYQQGQVEWRFGGRLDDFTFPDDPYGGPCAQHAARILANGHLMIWDNGSGALGANPSYCLDPADRSGPTVDRAVTRVTEYALDTSTMTATLVSSWTDPGRFAYFAGSVFRLSGGDNLVDWAAYRGALVSEVDPSGTIVWELSAPTSWSYRAQKADVPDTTDPVVDVTLPGSSRYDVGDAVTPSFTCTDSGGSTLQTCSASTLTTGTAGTRMFTVSATDGDGNLTQVQRSYTVGSPQPGLQVHGPDGWGSALSLSLTRRGVDRTATVRLANASVHAQRLALVVGAAPAGYQVHYRFAGHGITRAVLAGTWRTPSLAPGARTSVEVVVRREVLTGAGTRRLRIRAELPGVAGPRSVVELALRTS